MEQPTETDTITEPSQETQQTATLARRTPPPAFPKRTRALAKSLYLDGFSSGVIGNKLGIAPATVRRWAMVEKWALFRDEVKQLPKTSIRKMPARVAVAGITGSEQSQRVRSVLGDVIERQAAALASVEPKPSALGNTPQGQGHVAVLKTLAEAASTVFDWESQRAPGLVLIGEIEGAEPDPEPEAIDVQAESAQLADAEPQAEAPN